MKGGKPGGQRKSKDPTYQARASYCREDFQADILLKAVKGKALAETDKESVEKINKGFFPDFPVLPECLYLVSEVTRSGRIDRGLIFLTEKGWGFILRIDINSWFCPYKSLIAPPFCERWYKHRIEVVRHLVLISKNTWSYQSYHKTTANQVHSPTCSPDPHCRILGLKRPFTIRELKKAYRQSCFKHHPDTGDGNRQALTVVINAYRSLLSEF